MTDIPEECVRHADDDGSRDFQSSDHKEEVNHLEKADTEDSSEDIQSSTHDVDMDAPEKADENSGQDVQSSYEDEDMSYAEEANEKKSEDEEKVDNEKSKEVDDNEAAKKTDDNKGAKKTNGNEDGGIPKDAEDSEKGAANNVYDNEEERFWAPLEEMVRDGLITDPRPVISSEKPGKGAHQEREKLAKRFWQKWESRPSNTLTDEEEDEFLLTHATRHGLTPKAILAKGLLKSGNRNNPAEIAYRIKKLKGKKVDLVPRTKEQAWKEYKARTRRRTPRQQEANNLKAAIRRGETIEQIIASGIVSIGKNTRRAIRKRWDDWLRQGEDLPELPS